MRAAQKEIVKNPLVSYMFLLRVEAVYDLACTRVSGIVQEKEYENIQEGGVNDYVHLREKPASQPSILQIERCIGENYLNPLPTGKRLTLPLVLYVSRYAGSFTDAKMIFTFSGCTVIGRQYGDLDAQKSGLMTETVKIAYQTVAVETTDNELLLSLWHFDPTGKQYQGIGKRHAMYDKSELRKNEMQQQSRKWPGQRSARSIPAAGGITGC